MFKKYIPFAKATSIYEISIDFYKKLKIKCVLVDLDNTLDSYKLFIPSKRAYSLKKMFDDANIRMIIVSNNKGNRVKTYANNLNVPFISSAMKPFSFKLKQFIKDNKLDLNECLFIGDQMMTDVIAAKNAGIRVILTDKIVDEDQWTTHINRIFGSKIRKYHNRHGNFRDWREYL